MKNLLILFVLVFLTGFTGVPSGLHNNDFHSEKINSDFALPRIGDFVWEDISGMGCQEYFSQGIAGVEISLFDESGNQIGQTITSAADGSFSFENVTPGFYYLKFDASVVNSAYMETQANVCAEDIDSDVDGSNGPGTTALFELVAGEDKTDIDAGYYLPCTLGDFVWEDINVNGIQDDGELGIEGVEVELVNDFTNVVYSTTTDETGHYLFDSSYNLSPGEYHLIFYRPFKYLFTYRDIGNDDKDSDPNPVTGTTYFLSLESGDTTVDWDAGMYKSSTIEGFTWRDSDMDGIQDSDEIPMSNIMVKLFRESNDELIETTYTDDDGIYIFGEETEIKPDEYYIEFQLLLSFAFTLQNVGSDDMDSDANIVGITPVFSIQPGENIVNIDAGYYVEPPDNCDLNEPIGFCENAELLCSLNDLNQYCVEMVGQWESVPIPGCDENTFFFNNPSWFSFAAGATDVSLIIHAVSCTEGTGTLGIQWGVYDDCDLNTPITIQCTCVEPGNIPVNLTGLTIGQEYYFFIDGCSGTQCTYWIEILEGGNAPDIIGPENILCDSSNANYDSIFLGEYVTFTLDSVYNATSYTWIVNGTTGYSLNPDTLIGFDTVGVYDICAFGQNVCGVGDTVCKTVYVYDPCVNRSLIYELANQTCYSECSGSINIHDMVNGIKPFHYHWSTGDSLSYIDSLCAGTYYVTIVDSINCMYIDTFVITSPAELIANAYSTNESYSNAKDGTATVIVEGGVKPYKYLWNTGDTIAFIDSLSSGLYVVTVTDSLACIDVDTVVVDTFTCQDMFINMEQINALCFGECNGALKIISVANSTGPLEYKWSNGADSVSINNLCAGSYYVSVTDSLLCTVVDTFFISEPDAIIITIDTVLNITASNSGGIFISSNDSGNYIYKWNGPDGYMSNDKNATGLNEKGCYALTVTDTLTDCTVDTTVCVDKLTDLFEIDRYSLIVYPNPAMEKIILDFGNIDNSNSVISFLNNSGTVIFTKNINTKKRFVSYNINELSQGLYLIKITMNNRTVFFKKIIINR